ncbi:HIT-like domain-containing protein [Catenaria anguillulae PL171]|uniref:HIT-like domain-containing protein n=1 Tax=Catenaria anguillulae PL171 TaxID=765915 RepID=A0A1Y2HR83_9FUNG|nr:HIT-like domain-containing protein [Catenaria anguillulae PL171]
MTASTTRSAAHGIAAATTTRGPAHRAVRASHSSAAAGASATSTTPSRSDSRHGGGRGGSWHQALLPYTQHPETYDPAREVFAYSESTVTIYDQYPKSSVHLLVMPRRVVTNVSALDPAKEEDVRVVDQVDAECQRVLALMQAMHPTLRFRLGLHAVPSMTQLHVHLISQDFARAEKLKTKQHWNSFTTAFFVDWEWVVDEFKAGRKVTFEKQEYEQLLKSPLKCHECTDLPAFTNMPRLKAHLDSQPHGVRDDENASK